VGKKRTCGHFFGLRRERKKGEECGIFYFFWMGRLCKVVHGTCADVGEEGKKGGEKKKKRDCVMGERQHGG